MNNERIIPQFDCDISALLDKYAQMAHGEIEKRLAKTDARYEILFDSMKYSAMSGGKRIRPALTLMFADMFGGADSHVKVLPYAAAVEMIHTYSLIHDDLPCMDNDDLRRGLPTNHVKFGEAAALLAGDTLLTYAFEVCASNDSVSDKSVRNAVTELSSGAGAFGMAGGQMIDLINSGGEKLIALDELKYLHKLKTGALIKAASLLGYYAVCDDAAPEVISDIASYAYNIGLAFQIKDDILDVEGSAEFGKPIGSDARNGKMTILSYMSIAEAKEAAEKLTLEAIETMSKYEGSEAVCALAVYLLERRK